MIFFNTNFSNEMNTLFNSEKEILQYSLDSQKNLKSIVLKYIQSFVGFNTLDLNCANLILEILQNLKESLELCNSNISLSNIIMQDFEQIILSIQNQDPNLNELTNSYNKNYTVLNKLVSQNTLKIEQCLNDIFEKSDSDFISTLIVPSTQSEIIEEIIPEATKQEPQKTISETESIHKSEIVPSPEIDMQPIYIENTLIVSETSKKVTLPYKLSEVQELFENSAGKYSSIDEVIDEKFTLPIETFKNPFISRFKEAFKLMRNKEKSSFTESIELGVELMFNYNLHPAIISACKNLDELDIYLDYLEDGETNKFDCFKVVFQLPPAIIKSD